MLVYVLCGLLDLCDCFFPDIRALAQVVCVVFENLFQIHHAPFPPSIFAPQ